MAAFGPVQNTRTFSLGMWAVSGDSLLVTVDPVEGRVRLYAIGLKPYALGVQYVEGYRLDAPPSPPAPQVVEYDSAGVQIVGLDWASRQ